MPAIPQTQFGLIAGSTEQSPRWRVIAAVSLGNALEWFDFVIFGFFATLIARLFFPTDDPTASLLLALASFGVTFVLRPLGAVVLGRFADRRGRKAALQLSLFLMMAGSFAIAVVPVYATIGVLAPVVLTVARMVQGFSVGGEFGSATAFFVEQSSRRRGFYASWQFASQGLAAMLATGVGAAVTSLLTTQQIDDWGWRIPFVFGLIVGPIGLYIRRYISETPEFQSLAGASPPRHSFIAVARKPFLVATGLVVLGTVAVYTIIFMPTYAIRHLSLPVPNTFGAGLLTGAIQLAFIPLFGSLSDRIGRTAVPIAAAVAMLLGIFPAMAWLAEAPTIARLFLVQGILGMASAAYLGSVGALMAELFPAHMRGSGLAISYAISVAIFGGFAPFVHEWLIDATGSVLAPSYYLMFAAVIGLAALISARKLGHR